MKHLRTITIALVLILGLSITPGLAQDSSAAESVTIEMTSEGTFNTPQEIQGGVTSVTFDNEASMPLVPLFGRLNSDVTIEQFQQTMADAQSPAAVLSLVTMVGGPTTMPGKTADATYNLEAGTYALANFGSQPPQFSFFEVSAADSEASVDMEADVEVELHDFAYAAPIEVSAGEQTWLIENHGEQPHETYISKVDETTTVSEFQDLIANNIQQPYPGNLNLHNAGWAIMHPGQKAWVELNLEPGTYVLHCYVPNIRGDEQPHASHGMVQLITVTE